MALIQEEEHDLFSDENFLLWDEECEEFISSDSSNDENGSNTIINSTNDSTSILKKRKKSRVPRVLKNDIRRKYVSMIGNVFNNSEIDFFHSFFHTFSIDQVLFKKSCLASFGKKSGQKSSNTITATINRITEERDDVVFQNIDSMTCEWFLLHYLIPDEVLTIQDAKILTWPGNKRSVVTIDIECEFTRIYSVNPKKYLQTILSFYERKKRSLLSTKSNNDNCNDWLYAKKEKAPYQDICPLVTDIARIIPDPFEAYFEMTGQRIPVLQTPVKMKFATEFRLLLDENKCIEMMEIGEMRYLPV